MTTDERERASMLRVDQAGEYGATRIYAGQLAVLGDANPAARLVARMAAQEQRHLAHFDAILPGAPGDIERLAEVGGDISGPAFVSPVGDFYLTNPIARASAVMAECSALAKGGFKQAAE